MGKSWEGLILMWMLLGPTNGEGIMGFGESMGIHSHDYSNYALFSSTVEVTSFGETYQSCATQLCNSCPDNRRVASAEGYCFCDPGCIEAGDCCTNYASLCYGTNDGGETETTNLTTQLNFAVEAMKNRNGPKDPNPYTSCYSIDFDTGRGTIKLVDSCPLNSVEDIETINKCSGEGLDDMHKTTPVAYKHYNDTPKLYRNIHCLYCHHGRKLNRLPDNFIQTKPTYDCSDIDIRNEALAMGLNGSSNSLILSFIQQNCRFYLDSTGMVNVLKGYEFRLMKCHYLDKCNFSTFNGTLEKFKHVENLCQAYRGDVRVDNGDVMYKNAHCAMCNGVTELDLLICDDETVPQFPSAWKDLPVFSLLLDFTSASNDILTYTGTPICPDGLSYDYITEQCTSQTCGQGEVFMNNTCSFIDQSISFPSFPINENRRNSLYMTLLIYLIGQESDIVAHLLNEHIKSIVGLMPEIFYGCGEHYGLLMKENNFIDLCIRVKDDLISETTLGIDSHGTDVVEKLRLENFVLENRPYSENMTIKLVISPVASLTSGWDKFYCDPNDNDTHELALYQSLQLTTSREAKTIAERGRVIIGSEEYKYVDTPVMCHTEYNPSSQSTSKCEISVVACVPKIITCSIQAISISEIRLRRGSIIIEATGEIILEGHYAQLDNDWMAICTDKGRQQISYNHEEKIKAVLTLVGNVISCCLLAFSLLTYTLFKPLRTIPGLCIMNLSLALFLAQFTFQMGQLFRGLSELCTVLAVFQHYIWLTAFLWMSCLSYTTFKTFTRTNIHSNNQNKTCSRVLIMCIFAWGLPAIFLCLCVLLSNYGLLTFKYGSSESCWIVGSVGMIYFFAVPLAVILLINLTLFGFTLYSLRKTLSIAELVSEKDSKAVKRIAIYIKLSTVMGFTWIFGFLANLNVFSIFWYFFIVFNTLQGLFICWSFVINRRVMTLYGLKVTFLGSLSSKTSSDGSKGTEGLNLESSVAK